MQNSAVGVGDAKWKTFCVKWRLLLLLRRRGIASQASWGFAVLIALALALAGAVPSFRILLRSVAAAAVVLAAAIAAPTGLALTAAAPASSA